MAWEDGLSGEVSAGGCGKRSVSCEELGGRYRKGACKGVTRVICAAYWALVESGRLGVGI